MVDPQSRSFMAWAKKRLTDDEQYLDDVYNATAEFENFYALPKEDILNLLNKKLIKGAREHGRPIYTKRQVKRELELEFIDVLGWYLVGEWNAENKNKEYSR